MSSMPANNAQFKLFVVQKLERLGTQMNSLVGNGQPGRIYQIEQRVERNERVVWMIAGASIVASAVLRYAAHHFLGIDLP